MVEMWLSFKLLCKIYLGKQSVSAQRADDFQPLAVSDGDVIAEVVAEGDMPSTIQSEFPILELL
jgi:hypothetical protein